MPKRITISFKIIGPREDLRSIYKAINFDGSPVLLSNLYEDLGIYEPAKVISRRTSEQIVACEFGDEEVLSIETEGTYINNGTPYTDHFRALKQYYENICIYYLEKAVNLHGHFCLKLVTNDSEGRFFPKRYYIEDSGFHNHSGQFLTKEEFVDYMRKKTRDKKLSLEDITEDFPSGEYSDASDSSDSPWIIFTNIRLRKSDSDLTCQGTVPERTLYFKPVTGNYPAISKSVSLSKDEFRLSQQACDTLFTILVQDEHTASYDYLAEVLDMDEFDLNAACRSLIEKKLIIRNMNTFTADSERFASLGVKPYETIDELFADLNLAIKGKLNVEAFETYLKMSRNIQFAKGYFELGIPALSKVDKKAFFVIINHFYLKKGRPFTAEDLAEHNETREEITPGLNSLIGMGFVYTRKSSSEDSARYDFVLATKVIKALFRGIPNLIDYSYLSKFTTIIPATTIKKRDLFYDAENEEQIEIVRTILHPDSYSEITSILEEKDLAKGILCLLYGPPGTGKTELVRQLARSNGRDIIQADPAKIIDSFWGAAEKNIRNIFEAYRILFALSEKAPIMLFNECDALMHKRVAAEKSFALAENELQGIILEEMEQFEGIMFATTNLAESLDQAYERRFLFKIEAKSPSIDTRAKIWMSHIDGLSEDNAKYLAKSYDFSGGHIKNIASKCLIYFALHHRALPPLSDIITYCDAEKIAEKTSKNKDVKICGF